MLEVSVNQMLCDLYLSVSFLHVFYWINSLKLSLLLKNLKRQIRNSPTPNMTKLIECSLIKGNIQSKKSLAKMKEREKCKKKRAITDLNAPNGSRDIPSQSQEFGQDGHRPFVGFQSHFHLNMTSQTQYCKTMKK